MNSGYFVDHAARAEDVAWMAATGESLIGAARRLGIGVAGVEAWCRSHEMQAELATLKSRDPISPDVDRRDVGRRNAESRWAS